MKCPKCGYTSFPYLESCRKCGHGLAEQRAALGIYALRPDPPDLLLAYQAASMEDTGGALTHPVSTPGIDLGPLEGIDLEVAEAEPSGVGTDQVQEPADAVPDLMPTLDREPSGEEERPLVEPSTERPSSQDISMPQSLDLSGLEDITLEIDTAAELGGESPESPQTPSEAAAAKQVYDLDLDEDLGGLTLGSPADEAGTDEDTDEDDEATEYTLEIEEDVEFDVDALELEQDDELEDEDDDR